MGKKRVIFGSVALVCAGTYISDIRNPTLFATLQENTPSIETPDSRAIDGAWYNRKSPDADGLTRYDYRYADEKESKTCWPTKFFSCAPADKDLRNALEQAMQEVSDISNIQFRQVGHNEKTDFKVYGIENRPHPALGGLAVYRMGSFTEGKLMLRNHAVDLRPEDKKIVSCILDNKKNNETCITREQTPDEVQARIKLSKQFQEGAARHELMHMLGAKHSFHTDLTNFGVRTLPPDMENYKNTVMSSNSTDISEGQKITLGRLDREYLERHNGAPTKKKPTFPRR